MLLSLLTLLAAHDPAPSHGRGQDLRTEERHASPDEAWIPVTFHLSSYAYLRGTLNGVETDMVLDSGAGMSVIDTALAQRLGLAPAEDKAAERGVRFVESLEIVLGSTRFTLPRALQLDVGGVHTSIGRELPVILGREIFERFVVDLDHPHARVALRAPAPFAYRGPGRTLALLAAEPGQHVVEASIEDLPPARFALDTGSRTLALHAAFTREHDLLAERLPISAAFTGALGTEAVERMATLRSLTLAGYRFTNVPAAFAEGDAAAVSTIGSPDALAGSLGAEILARFRVIFDVSRASVHLEPASDWETRPFGRDRLGLAAVLRGESLEVTFVAPGSPAAQAGWKTGERIVALNGVPVSPATWSTSLARCVESAPGVEVTLTDGAGRARKLVAADYY